MSTLNSIVPQFSTSFYEEKIVIYKFDHKFVLTNDSLDAVKIS